MTTTTEEGYIDAMEEIAELVGVECDAELWQAVRELELESLSEAISRGRTL